jgi:hypothetical protein
MKNVSMLQYLLLRPILEKQTAPAIPENPELTVSTSSQGASPAAAYLGTIRDFEKVLRWAGWSRTESKIDCRLGGTHS